MELSMMVWVLMVEVCGGFSGNYLSVRKKLFHIEMLLGNPPYPSQMKKYFFNLKEQIYEYT